MGSPLLPPSHGAWSEEVLLSFLRLTSEQTIRAIEAGAPPDGGILGYAPPSETAVARRERIDAFLAGIRQHEGYSRLQNFPGLKLVMAERRRLANGNGLFAEPF